MRILQCCTPVVRSPYPTFRVHPGAVHAVAKLIRRAAKEVRTPDSFPHHLTITSSESYNRSAVNLNLPPQSSTSPPPPAPHVSTAPLLCDIHLPTTLFHHGGPRVLHHQTQRSPAACTSSAAHALDTTTPSRKSQPCSDLPLL